MRHSVRQVPDRDDLPPRRTKTLMALPDTHPYFVVLRTVVLLFRDLSSFHFNFEAVCSFELGALRLASPVASDVSACFRCSFPSFSDQEIVNWLGSSSVPLAGFRLASWNRQLLEYGIELKTFWNPRTPLPEPTWSAHPSRPLVSLTPHAPLSTTPCSAAYHPCSAVYHPTLRCLPPHAPLSTAPRSAVCHPMRISKD